MSKSHQESFSVKFLFNLFTIAIKTYLLNDRKNSPVTVLEKISDYLIF